MKLRKLKEKEKYVLKFIFACAKNQKAEIKAVGKTVDLLILLVAISKCLTERISKKKEVSIGEAEDMVVDCIRDYMKTVKE